MVVSVLLCAKGTNYDTRLYHFCLKILFHQRASICGTMCTYVYTVYVCMWAAGFKIIEPYRRQTNIMLLMYLPWLPAARHLSKALPAYSTQKNNVGRAPFVYFILPPPTVGDLANTIYDQWPQRAMASEWLRVLY